MAVTEPMHDPSVAMHAILSKADARLNSKGEKSYKIAFTFPASFVAAVDAIIGEGVDVYWNEDLVALNALVTGTTAKVVKDEDPLHTISLDADAGDTERGNLANEIGHAGDCRLRVTQMAANLA